MPFRVSDGVAEPFTIGRHGMIVPAIRIVVSNDNRGISPGIVLLKVIHNVHDKLLFIQRI